MPATSTSFFAWSAAWEAAFSRGLCTRPASGASARPPSLIWAVWSGVGVDHFGEHAPKRNLTRRRAPDDHEQAAFVRQRARPGELGQHVLDRPVVLGGPEQSVARQLFCGEQRVRVRAQVLDAVLAEPALHFTEGVAVLLDVAVLVAQPGLAAGRPRAARAPYRGPGGPVG